MDCQQAREQIDIRIHEGVTSRRDWSELEAHLSRCATCSAELVELTRTRELLADISSDKPKVEEFETMWNTIAAAGTSTRGGTTGLWRNVKPFVMPATAVAAVLGMAFIVGGLRYNSFDLDAVRQQVSRLGFSGGADVFSGVNTPLPVPSSARTRQGPESVARNARRAGGRTSVVPVPDTVAFGKLNASSPDSENKGIGTSAKIYANDKNESWMVPPFQALASGGGVEYNVQSEPHSRRNHEDSDALGGYWMSKDESVRNSSDPLPTTIMQEGTLDTDKLISLNSVPAGPPGSAVALLRTLDTDGDGVADSSVDTPADEPRDARPGTSTQSPPTPAPADNAKIIKTGEMTLEVESYRDAKSRIESIVIEHGAFIADAATREQTGGALSGRVVVRVQPEGFDALFSALKTIGRVEAENAKAADVTANYVDMESRIQGLRITEQRLAELITNKSFVDKMSSLLEVEREMTRVRSQLEQLMGQLRVMADRVALSTISITIHEPVRIVPSAGLSVEVAELSNAAHALGEALTRVGGRLASGKTSKYDAGALRGDYQLRVSVARFAELVSAIESLGRVEQRQINDRQFGDASVPWAQNVECNLSLVLYEQSRQLPSGSMSVEVDALTAALEQLDELLTPAGGSIISNNANRRRDGSSVAEVMVRIPAGRFASVTEAVAALGRVTGRSISGEAGRIVGGSAEVPCNLSLSLAERVREVPSGKVVLEVEAFESARNRLSKLVGEHDVQVMASSSNQRGDGSWAGNFRLGIKAGDLEKVLAGMESLGRVASRQISGTGLGDLSRVDPAAIGVIDLTLGEKAAINPAPEQAGGSIRNQLRDGLAGLYASLGLIAYGLIVMAPWLVIVVLVAVLVTRIRRRRALATAGATT